MSVSVHDVRHALNELGKLRFGEMRVEDAMHQIVQTTHAIFSVDGAGLMLADVDHHLLNAAVSDERMGHLEELQIRHQEGPCIAAFEDKELVCAEDLTTEERWPRSPTWPPCSSPACSSASSRPSWRSSCSRP
jgi:hypothetical protein